MDTTKLLKVNDVVLWRGGFGNQAPTRATVASIEVTLGEKYGDSVESIPWRTVRGRYCVVVLTNGHWAYGEQLAPLEVPCETP